MTEKPESDDVVTVAELLARHGQVSGAGGRAHRRRAREGGISVAELTGEIPIVQEPDADPKATARADVETAEAETAEAETAETETAEAETAGAPAEEPRAYSELAAVADAGPQSPRVFAATASFPAMTPLASSIQSADAATESTAPTEGPAPVADEAPAEGKGALRQWAALAAQAVVGVAVGAALFVGFERLWDNLPYVALVLAILVILALVAVVRILRKTDDIVSMLMAVVVGVIVTIGPLAFVLSTR